LTKTLWALCIAVCGVVSGVSSPAEPPKASEPQAYQLSGDIAGTHDPSIIKEDGTWYVFASGKDASGGHIPIRCSNDLKSWKHCGSVFPDLPDWIVSDEQVPLAQGIWAPDISYYDGKFHLYYAYSLFGKNTSGIGLATNVTLNSKRPDYHWQDEGLVLRSTAADNFNAIDPNLVIDRSGQTWLVFGSFWSGIRMRKIDRATGKPSEKDTTLYALAARAEPPNAASAPPGLPPDWEAVEALFIVSHGGYYYLFVSWDLCCRGIRSTYRTMMGRARTVTGPYFDQSGLAMSNGGGSELLKANGTWLGPGGESVLLGTHKDPDIIVYHAYDAVTGKPSLHISTLTWKDGWPTAAVIDTRQQQTPAETH
jgi:arabinan endo-1,5-alpha-L-arabinosidase